MSDMTSDGKTTQVHRGDGRVRWVRPGPDVSRGHEVASGVTEGRKWTYDVHVPVSDWPETLQGMSRVVVT